MPWDWALDFRNVRVSVSSSAQRGSRNPLHFQRGALDNQIFGYADLGDNEIPHCVLLSDPSVTADIPAEYLRPVRPNAPGQLVIVVNGPEGQKGQQRTTDYLNEGQWMMVPEPGLGEAVPMIVAESELCRIWN
jgi:transcription elongation factor SPT5